VLLWSVQVERLIDTLEHVALGYDDARWSFFDIDDDSATCLDSYPYKKRGYYYITNILIY
jgi:hypothetical protein